jgi:hypothetical protein
MDGSPFSYAVMLERSDNVQTRKALYIICQVASYSAVYKIKILNGSLKSCHDKILVPHCIMDNMYNHEDDLTNSLAHGISFVAVNTSMLFHTKEMTSPRVVCIREPSTAVLQQSLFVMNFQ